MFDLLFRRPILNKLSAIKVGQIDLELPGESLKLGDRNSQVYARVNIHRKRVFRRIAVGGDLGAAESYMDGDWDCDDLTSLVRIMIANLSTTDRLGRGLASIRSTLARWHRALLPNNRRHARKSIHQHYDLGNDFFASFLDRTMSYSSAIFQHPDDSLYDASIHKMQGVCEKLRLTPRNHLLEIGTGWGGLALFVARNYGCRVTTTTISGEQFRLARYRVQQAGLEHLVTVLNDDYRDLSGSYDRIVSIEMIEAVGHKFLSRFFGKCGELLSDEGLMLLQGIVIRDQRFKFHTQNIDFMRHYIFPGGCLPSVTALLNAMTSGSQLRMVHMEDIVAHYPPTLRAWLNNFDANIGRIQELGLDESFVRMWRFYLCYCEAAFLERQVNNIQALFAGPASRLDVTKPDTREKTNDNKFRPHATQPVLQEQKLTSQVLIGANSQGMEQSV